MTLFDLARANLLSAQPLCFVLGALAVALRGDLKLPRQAFDTLAIYLMLAIGLRGGAELTELPFVRIAGPALAALGLGVGIPIWCFAGLRWRGRYSAADAASLAAHYGSVSAVTFAASLAYTEVIGATSESFMPALLALMEAPAIIVSLALARGNGPGPGGIVAVLGEVLGGATVLGTLAASASYIAAPAAIWVGLPEANLPLSLAASLAITFPFNLILGLPIYAPLAHWLSGG